jgi:alkanesulfonate monooxygenase SsuD/methylene tetrahydromethanopterin reductase-like flavin-dependent oxidoreductase (luciferase family)
MFARKSALLDELLRQRGRQPESVRRSLMTGILFGRNAEEVQRKVTQRTGGKRTLDELRQRGAVAGTGEEVAVQLRALEAAGVQRVMLQWLDLDDIQGLEAMAAAILP